MATRSSADVGFLLIGGRTVLGAPLTEIVETWEQLVEQVDGLGDSVDKWSGVGQRILTLEQRGFYNSGAAGLHEALEAADPQVLLYAPEGNVIGRYGVALAGVRTVYDRLPRRGEHTKARALYRANNTYQKSPEAGLILGDHVARTTLGPTDGTIVDAGAASTNGGAIYLGLSALALDGGSSITISVRHSTDNFVANDVELAAFTNVTAAPAAERVAVSGTINRYRRIRHLFNGASGAARSATFAVILGTH